jgi:hypothetical protein
VPPSAGAKRFTLGVVLDVCQPELASTKRNRIRKKRIDRVHQAESISELDREIKLRKKIRNGGEGKLGTAFAATAVQELSLGLEFRKLQPNCEREKRSLSSSSWS